MLNLFYFDQYIITTDGVQEKSTPAITYLLFVCPVRDAHPEQQSSSNLHQLVCQFHHDGNRVSLFSASYNNCMLEDLKWRLLVTSGSKQYSACHWYDTIRRRKQITDYKKYYYMNIK